MNDKLRTLTAEIAPLLSALACAGQLDADDYPPGELLEALGAIEDRARELMSEIKKLSDTE